MARRVAGVTSALLWLAQSLLAQSLPSRAHGENHQGGTENLPAMSDVACTDNFAGEFACDRIDLLSLMPLADMGGPDGHGADLWGWTDGDTGREFVLFTRDEGTAFIEITSPLMPIYLGLLPSHGNASSWRDVKVYRGHAYVVSEAPGHGMQIFALDQLLAVKAPPVRFEETAHYGAVELSRSHNIAINETSGFAYIVGSNTCDGGLHMVNLANPLEPTFAGCFDQDGYTHDAQCVSYHGPDGDYRDREICVAANEDTLTIVDVTNKSQPRQVSRTSYEGVAYTHQSWMTEDQLYLLLNDELDEENFGHNTTTRIWDITDLDRPALIGLHVASTPSTDHNLYIREGFAYLANYRSGLRIYDLSAIAEGRLQQAGVFDVYRADDRVGYNGAWSVYPFFPSGVVAVSGIEQGLFLLQPRFGSRQN